MSVEFHFVREHQMRDRPKVDVYFVTMDNDTEPRYEIEVLESGVIRYVGEFSGYEGELIYGSAQSKRELQTCFDEYMKDLKSHK